MGWLKEYLLPLLALLSLLGGVVLGIAYADESGSPDTSWIQSGASLSLIFITFQYVRVTQRSLEESRASRESAEHSLEELRKARMDSFRPSLSLRYLIKDKNTGPTQGKVKTTCLINTGLGPAMAIKVFSNLEWREQDPQSKLWYVTALTPWPTQEKSFGVPLGPDNGNENMQIEFISMKLHPYGYSPVEDPEVVFLIQYQDSFGRSFITTQRDCTQQVFGPMADDERKKIKAELEELCTTRETFRAVDLNV